MTTTTVSSDPLTNGTIQPSRIPRSSSSTIHDRKQNSPTSTRNDETISPVTRKPPRVDGMLQTRNRRPLSRTSLLPFPPPPPSATTRRQETYLILHPKDDKSERRVVVVPPSSAAPVRVGRVVNPKTPAKSDNLLFDTKVLSRNHAEVFSDGQGRVFIRDLGSSNGTYINGYRLSADAVASEPFQLMVGQELALGIDIREDTTQDNIAYHRVWFTVEHVGVMSPPPPDAPTPATLGAVDLDPWIPKPTTRDIVDHLVQEINAAKQIAEEITCVQSVLDGILEGESGGDAIERVQKELEEKTKRVEELEGLLGAERAERRQLEERIRIMEDERALKVVIPVDDDNLANTDEIENNVEETLTETVGKKDIQASPITSLAIPESDHPVDGPTTSDHPLIEVNSPPLSPSTAPSSPLQGPSSRSISPISLPSTESSNNPEATHLLEKITSLESQLLVAQKQIEEYKSKLEMSSPVLAAVTSSIDFPFTFNAPPTTPTKRSRTTGSLRTPGSLRRRKAEPIITELEVEKTNDDVENKPNEIMSKADTKELIDGLCAAMGVVVLGWVGMWFVNHLVERGDRMVK